MKSTLRSSLAVLCALGSVSAYALQPLNTDDTGTQGAGGNQLELSVDSTRLRESGQFGRSGRDRTTETAVTYTRGITETLDVSLGVPYLRNRPGLKDPGTGEHDKSTSGMGNTSISAKWRFFDNEASGTSLAIAPEILIPVSSSRQKDDLGAGRVSGGVALLLTQEVPFGAVHVNLGVGKERMRSLKNVENPGDRQSAQSNRSTSFSVAPVWEVTETFQLALDVGVERVKEGKVRYEDGLGGEDMTRSLSRTGRFVGLGAIWTPHKDVDLALGYFRSKMNGSNSHAVATEKEDSIRAGVTFRF